MKNRTEDVAERAEQELVAQLAIVRALKPFGQDQRERLLNCLGHLVVADACVPGVLAAAMRVETKEKANA